MEVYIYFFVEKYDYFCTSWSKDDVILDTSNWVTPARMSQQFEIEVKYSELYHWPFNQL